MADRYFVNGGVDNNWGTTGNWSTTSGGAGGSAVPLVTDAVFFDANSPNCTINTTARVAQSLTTTGYANTLTFTAGLSVSGSITLNAGITFAGAAALSMLATGTVTTNGKTLSVPFTFGSGSFTATISGTMTVSALLTWTGGSGATMVINGDDIHASGSVNITNRIFISGTSALVLTGTGTLTRNNLESNFNNDIDINTAGTITFSGIPGRTAGTTTLTAGTIAGSWLVIGGGGGTTGGAWAFAG